MNRCNGNSTTEMEGRPGVPEGNAAGPELAEILRDLAGLLRELRDQRAAPAPATLDARELAAFLGVSLSTIERLKSSGRLPAPITIGAGCYRWRRAEVEAWLGAGCPARREWEALRRQGR